MRIEFWEDKINGTFHFKGEFSGFDKVKAMKPGDIEMLEECDRSNKVSDKLVGLEIIARRIEERNRAIIGVGDGEKEMEFGDGDLMSLIDRGEDGEEEGDTEGGEGSVQGDDPGDSGGPDFLNSSK